MNYDKASFLAGFAAGRALWRPPVRRPGGKTLETCGLRYGTNELVSVHGNVITMRAGNWRDPGHAFSIDSGEFAVGSVIALHLVVTELWQRLWFNNRAGGADAADLAGTGVFPDGLNCTQLGEATIRFTKDYPSQTVGFVPLALDGGQDSGAYATVVLDRLTVNGRVIVGEE